MREEIISLSPRFEPQPPRMQGHFKSTPPRQKCPGGRSKILYNANATVILPSRSEFIFNFILNRVLADNELFGHLGCT
jgi:hypothetical protein